MSAILGIDAFIVILSLGVGPPTRFPVASCENFPLDRWWAQVKAWRKRSGIPEPELDPAGTLVYVCFKESTLESLDEQKDWKVLKFYHSSVLVNLPPDIPR